MALFKRISRFFAIPASAAFLSGCCFLPAAAAEFSAAGTRIDDQSFEVELDGYGTVTFESYAPEDSAGHGDAIFCLSDGATVLSELPGVTADNIRAGQTFSFVAAVSFTDYNQDSRKDILVLTAYTSDAAPENDFQEIRLYTQYGNEGNGFLLDTVLMNWVENQNACDTIASVLESIQSYRESGYAFQPGTDPSSGSGTAADGSDTQSGGASSGDSDTQAGGSASSGGGDTQSGAPDSADDGNTAQGSGITQSDSEAREQIAFLAGHVSEWAQEEVMGSVWNYTVTDLDQNERLEVIASSMQGTGLFTYSMIYEINDSANGLTQVFAPSEYNSDADIITDTATVYYDLDDDLYYYIFSDLIRNGMAESSETLLSLSLSGGTLTQTTLAAMSSIAQDDTVTVTFRDANGTEIDESAYQKAADTTYRSQHKMTASFSWYTSDTDSGIAGLTIAELEEVLQECFAGFSLADF